MRFDYFSSVSSRGEVCTRSLFLKAVNDAALLPLYDRIASAADQNERQQLKRNLPAVTWQAHFEDGKRSNKAAISSGLFILDVDHEVDPFTLYSEKVAPRIDELGIMVVHMTPSKCGIRVVARLQPQFVSIEENQRWLSDQIGVDYDSATKDFARLSYLVPESYFFHLDQDVFDMEAPFVLENSLSLALPSKGGDKTIRTESAEQDNSQKDTNSIKGNDETIRTASPKEAFLFQEETGKEASLLFKGIPLLDITRDLLRQTGGEPIEGERNSRLYEVGRMMRHLCDFNPQRLAQALPHYNLSDEEVLRIARNACNAEMTAMPKVVRSAVERLSKEVVDWGDDEENDGGNALPLPPLPPLFKEMVAGAPQQFKVPMVLSMLPVVGTLGSRLRASYINGEVHSPSFLAMVVGPQASGKSFARKMQNRLLGRVIEHDEKEREREQEWRDQCRMKKNDKKQPEEPKTLVRCVSGSISVAQFIKRMKIAQGLHLFSFVEEIDTIVKSNSAGAWAQKTDIYRNAFDNAIYGQDFRSDQSYSAQVPVYYNYLFCGTPQAFARFIRNDEDGTKSRHIIIDMPDQFGADIPIWKPLTESQNAIVDRQIERLMGVCQDSEGHIQPEYTLQMGWLNEALQKWLRQTQAVAVKNIDRALDTFCRRAAVIGFRAGMLAYFLWNDDKRRSSCKKFAIWVAEKTLNAIMNHISRAEFDNLDAENGGKKSRDLLYDSLPKEFDKATLETKAKEMGIKSSARLIICIWNKRNMIRKVAHNQWIKI